MSILDTYPRKRKSLPEEYQKIYAKHYDENRGGKTRASYWGKKMEEWLHKQVAQTASVEKDTLEIGAGTLNQLEYEKSDIYDIVEPFHELFENVSAKENIRNFYDDISEVPNINKYDRVTAIACFEHIGDLPDVLVKSCELLKPDGKLCVAIPNEGRFLWRFSYTHTTGKEFRRKYNLDYEVLMRYEHINSADEIEELLNIYFKNVKLKLCGVGKTFSFYRYYECSSPLR